MRHAPFARVATPLRLGAVVLAVAAGAIGLRFTHAIFTSSQGVGGNTISTRADWAAPATSQAVVLNDIGYTSALRQGSTYRVCAQVADEGNPSSGVASASANMAVAGNVITTGATSVSLTAGSFTCGGNSFNYQSANQSANASIAEGSRSFQVTATDNLSQSATTTWSATMDNTAPTVASFGTVNTGGTAGLMESGDSFTVTVSEAGIDLPRALASWNGSASGVFVKVLNNGFGGAKDGLWVCSANTANCAGGTNADTILGAVNLNNKDYVSGTVVFNASIAWDSANNRFTVTLGSCSSGCTSAGTGGSSTATFAPIAGSSQGGVRDQAGNNMSTTSTATETGVHF